MKALIFCNGEGGGFHDPVETSEMFRDGLQAAGVEVELHKTMDCLSDAEHLKKMDLIIPNWTMGRLEGPHEGNLSNAIAGGTGLAGVHGGAGDAFRHSLGYQWMVGGQFVGHPYCDEFEVTLTSAGKRNPITAGMASPFKYKSEQYYLLVDPGNKVLATTVYLGNKAHQQGRGKMKLPMVWTKTWGKGRVFYSALGHAAKEFRDYPQVLEMTIRGMLWAAGKKF